MRKTGRQTPYYTINGIIQRGLPVLIVTCVMGIVVGQILNSREKSLISMPAILILIPSLIKIGGDTGSMLGARLSSAFHMGLGDNLRSNPVVHNSVIAAAIVGFVSSISVSILVFMASSFLGFGMPYLIILKISLIAVIIELVVVYSATVAIAFISHRFGIDPDDTVIPFIASLGDLVGVTGIFVALYLLNIL
ncbi:MULTISPECIES: magnesium transporter [Methanosarcina]|uniref:Mg/Co/Ni transporter MgtE n=3 Tax=Methanosarcina barkeri TaxID=2208 RepID=A0A0E3LNE9_METBA|nr:MULTISPECIES: magnesium transporter [Methanosarcina]AKB54651.1 Mg/Co/Ni transporter MgtE [Methanosarcina barkeri MS]AKB57266.1 Mg/Co/Ni transporter MgtE [Methanosarcina barkeri 227]AKJ37822.1 MgtE family transporter [Methanosarcina barkeri CM1]